MVPLRIFCLARKASSVRAITSTIALPMPRTSNRVAAMRTLPPKMRAHYSGRIARGNRAPQILATVAMGSAIFGMLELIASPSDAGGSLARLAVLALLVALGLAVYVACLELLGVARVHDLLAAFRRLCAGLAPAPRVMASGGAIGEGFPAWPSRSGCFPACSRPATCTSAIISAPS